MAGKNMTYVTVLRQQRIERIRLDNTHPVQKWHMDGKGRVVREEEYWPILCFLQTRLQPMQTCIIQTALWLSWKKSIEHDQTALCGVLDAMDEAILRPRHAKDVEECSSIIMVADHQSEGRLKLGQFIGQSAICNFIARFAEISGEYHQFRVRMIPVDIGDTGLKSR
jgi:hypothetical protein